MMPAPTASVNLLPTRPVGGPASLGTRGKQKPLPFYVLHIPHDDAVLTSDVQNSFDRGSRSQAITWTAGMLLQDVDVTFIEDDAGRTHYFTSGSWVGEPDIDTDTGEVTGMSIASDQYRAV